jgi:hypothetical protein
MRSVRKKTSDRTLKTIHDVGKLSVKKVITTGNAYIFIINNNNINMFQFNLKKKKTSLCATHTGNILRQNKKALVL